MIPCQHGLLVDFLMPDYGQTNSSTFACRTFVHSIVSVIIRIPSHHNPMTPCTSTLLELKQELEKEQVQWIVLHHLLHQHWESSRFLLLADRDLVLLS